MCTLPLLQVPNGSQQVPPGAFSAWPSTYCGTDTTLLSLSLPSLPILSLGVGYLSKTGQKSGTRRLVRPSTGLLCCFDLAGQWSPLLDSPGLTRDDWLFPVGGTSLLMDKEVHTQYVSTLLWTACIFHALAIQSHFHFQHFRTDYGVCTRIQKRRGTHTSPLRTWSSIQRTRPSSSQLQLDGLSRRGSYDDALFCHLAFPAFLCHPPFLLLSK